MNTNTQSLGALALAAVITASSAQAATITQTVNQSSSSSSGWTAAIWGTPAAAASAANDYIVPSGFTLRTPEAGNSTFVGTKLRIDGGTLALKAFGSATRTNTINNLELNGATIGNFTDGTGLTQTLAGSLTIIGTTTTISRAGATGQLRNNQFTASVAGGIGATFEMVNSGSAGSTSIFTNASNTYAGLWLLTSGNLLFTNLGSVGTGSVRVNGGTLQIQNNWAGTGATLNTQGGTIELTNAATNYNWTVSGLTIGTTNVAAGATYTAAQLNAISGGAFGTFTGAGTITVVPEPTSAMLLGVVGMGLLLRRRR